MNKLIFVVLALAAVTVSADRKFTVHILQHFLYPIIIITVAIVIAFLASLTPIVTIISIIIKC
jgi:hypothetical protein